jgi:hypothetical protein
MRKRDRGKAENDGHKEVPCGDRRPRKRWRRTQSTER